MASNIASTFLNVILTKMLSILEVISRFGRTVWKIFLSSRFAVISTLIGLISSSLGIGIFVAPMVESMFIYSDEQFESDINRIRELFYLKEESMKVTGTQIDMVLSRRYSQELVLMKVVLALEAHDVEQARSLLAAVNLSNLGPDGRTAFEYYDLAIDLAKANPSAPLWFSLMTSRDTGSVYFGPNISSRTISEFLRDHPNPWLIYPLLGRTHQALPMSSAATSIIRKTPEFAWGYMIRARSSFAALTDASFRDSVKKTDDELALSMISDLQIAIALSPNTASAYYLRARAYESLADYENAELDYSKSIELNTSDCELYLSRGVLYSKIGRNNDALKDTSSAIEKCPSLLQAYQNRGSTYYKLGHIEQAIADLSYVIERSSKDLSLVARNDRAGMLTSKGFWERGCEDYKYLVEYEETTTKRLRASAYNGLATCNEHNEQFGEAIQSYQRALENVDDDDLSMTISINLYDMCIKHAGWFIAAGVRSPDTTNLWADILGKVRDGDSIQRVTPEIRLGVVAFIDSCIMIVSKDQQIEARKEYFGSSSGAELGIFLVALERKNDIKLLPPEAAELIQELQLKIRDDPTAKQVYESLRRKISSK